MKPFRSRVWLAGPVRAAIYSGPGLCTLLVWFRHRTVVSLRLA